MSVYAAAPIAVSISNSIPGTIFPHLFKNCFMLAELCWKIDLTLSKLNKYFRIHLHSREQQNSAMTVKNLHVILQKLKMTWMYNFCF